MKDSSMRQSRSVSTDDTASGETRRTFLRVALAGLLAGLATGLTAASAQAGGDTGPTTLTIATGAPAVLDLAERARTAAGPRSLRMTVVPDRLSGSGKLILEVHAGAGATRRPLAVYAYFPPAQLGQKREIVLALRAREDGDPISDRISIHVKGSPGFGTGDRVVLKVPSYSLR